MGNRPQERNSIMKIYLSKNRENPKNCLYPQCVDLTVETSNETLCSAFKRDYVGARYKDFRRSNEAFLESDCLMLDCDNDHTDDPKLWVSSEDVIREFPGVFIIFHMSRNNMKSKGKKAARPKFHALFLIKKCTDVKEYGEMKQRVYQLFPFFDNNALDGGRFFFGTETPEVSASGGTKALNDVIEDLEFAALDNKDDFIPEGQRNSMMHSFAIKVLKRYGDTDEARLLFNERAELCVPPLEEEELETIYRSALKFYKERIATSNDYQSPGAFNKASIYKPEDYSDVGQAKVFATHYKDLISYNDKMHFMTYKDDRWQEVDAYARGAVHRFLDAQLKEALELKKQTYFSLSDGVINKLAIHGRNKVYEQLTPEERENYDAYLDSLEYVKFVKGRRNSNYISALLKEVQDYIYLKESEFDNKPYLLCTPKGTYDLNIGISSLKPNDPKNHITKITAVSPSLKGKEIFDSFLKRVFQDDQELIDYVQLVCGIASIGKVFIEGLVIAFGDGGNGKSTFWNTIYKVFGEYSGLFASDNLFVNFRGNQKFDTANLRGKRLIIISESEDGARMNDGSIKKLCSTDEIQGEKKFKEQFSFAPSHTMILYTNHLPKVSATDDGIWRRLIIVPFKMKFRGDGDIKDYSSYLFEEAGEYILLWIMEGAKKAINLKFHITLPKAVEEATKEYREENDWFQNFISNGCDLSDPNARTQAKEMYDAYKVFATERKELVQPMRVFTKLMAITGFKTISRQNRLFYLGIKPNDDAADDFLD